MDGEKLTDEQIVERVTGINVGHNPLVVAFIKAGYRVGDRDGYARGLAAGRREVLDVLNAVRRVRGDGPYCLATIVAMIENQLAKGDRDGT